jgi:LPXTG-motif cell wall-anchored protein
MPVAALDSHTRVVAGAVGAAALVTLGLSSPSFAEPNPPGQQSDGTTWEAVGAATPGHTVRLVTGEVLRITQPPDGMPYVGFVDPAHSSTYMRAVDSSGDLELVPNVAFPYVGNELDPALFNASELIRDGYGTSDTATVPVSVSFLAGAVDVPGLTVTGSLPNGEVVGYVDAAGAQELGAAIAALDGRTFLPGVASITLRGATPPAADEPTGPLSSLHVEVLPPADGPDLRGGIAIMGLDTGAFDVYPVSAGALEVTVDVPDGPYAVFFYGDRSPGADQLTMYGVGEPQLAVSGPTELVLDTADTNEATYEIDGANPTDNAVELTSIRLTDTLSAGFGWGALLFKDVRVFLAPTAPISQGTFDQVISWAGQDPDSGWFYTLPVVIHDQIPADLTYVFGPDDLATIVNHYARDVDGQYYVGRIAATVAGGGTAITPNDAPGDRVDVVTVKEVVTAGTVLLDAAGWIGMDRVAVAPEGGTTVDESWITRPVRPAVPEGLKGGAPSRVGDEMFIAVMTFVDPGFAFGRADPGVNQPSIDTVTSELKEDGEVVYTGTELFGSPIAVGSDPATYELTLDVARDADWWLTSTKNHTTWTFDSEHVDRSAPLDVLQIDYDVTLDPYNTGDAPLDVAFRPYNLATPDGSTIADLTAEWSVDDGDTWSDVADLSVEDGWWHGTIKGNVCNNSCTLPVTLRVMATDATGATIEQTIERAFNASFVAEPPTSTPPTSTPPTSTPPTSTPPTTTDTATPTTTGTLPGTGASGISPLTALGTIALLTGAAVVVVARRRLRSEN